MKSMQRKITSLTSLVASLSACQAVFDFDRGTLAPANRDGGSSGAGRGGRNATGSGGSTAATGGSLSSGGKSASGGSGASGATGGTNATTGKGGAAGTDGPGRSGGTDASGGDPGSGGFTTDGGEAGAGGQGGLDSGECELHSDCPVVDPDCVMECRPGLAGNECVAVAADRDHDSHGSAACEKAPGDDCDDTRDDVYPNAPELCDRRDNDCDGKRDFDDGRKLLSGPTTLTYDQASDADIAWSPSERTWGTVWNTGGSIMYLPLDAGGAPHIDPIVASDVLWNGYNVLSNAEGERSHAALATLPPIPADHQVSIAWGEDGETGGFGLAYPGPYWDVVFGALTTSGEPLFAAWPLTDYSYGWGSEWPDLVWLPSENAWGSAWVDLRDNAFSGIVRTVSLSGSYGPEVFMGTGVFTRVATNGTHFAGAWTGVYGSQGTLMSAGLTGAVPLDVDSGLNLEYPKIAARSDRFGVVARLPPDKFVYTEFNLDGSIRCGPVLRESNGFVYSDIVAGGDGFLILAGRPSTQMLEVLPGCEFGSTIELDPEPARFVRAVNAGEDGIGVILGGVERSLHVRLLGPNYCD
jgi:hypothetical protein